jgi:hypothetical protein
MINFIFSIVFFVLWVYIIITGQGRRHGRRIYKKVCMISSVISYSGESSLEFLSKNETFFIRIEDAEVPSGLKYKSIPAYTCKNVFINDELACKVHTLSDPDISQNNCCVEFSSKRYEYEIEELITTAYKFAKKLDRIQKHMILTRLTQEVSFYKDTTHKDL